MMSFEKAAADDDDDFALEVVVERRGAAAAFDVPPGWQYEEHVVDGATVQVLTPAHAAGVAARMPVVTFHDVAMNGASCFAGFFSFCRGAGACPELDTAAAHYHVTAPGHLADAADVGEDVPFGVASLAQTVVAVIDRFDLRRVIGIGFGLGGTVLTAAALDAPGRFGGLVLLSPLLYAAGVVERAFTGADALYTRGVGLGRRAKDRFLERWLSPGARDANIDLTMAIEDEMDRLNIPNMLRYVAAEVQREDLAGRVGALKAKTLLVSGRESPLRFHAEDGYSAFNPAKVTWLDVTDAGALVIEEKPEKVARALSLFLQSFGEYSK